jgi:hypothetical protein
MGVPEDIIEVLVEIKDSGIDEKSIVIVFLYLLTLDKYPMEKLNKSTKRIFTKAYKHLSVISDDVQQRIKEAIVSYYQTNGS